jgi:hypothetical protein
MLDLQDVEFGGDSPQQRSSPAKVNYVNLALVIGEEKRVCCDGKAAMLK